ncbi:V8-like Glu-specific endopeptidase [Clavibacter sp. B3I6]|uniref:trypsin-like serine peptidase n=1 Tax=Clavibacter sp. B3I6 TaxID=3042268 RepID=UPI002788DFB4|nr:serine protease [Clavibacter sp. B3I6]MDQ0742725.1 V8-like Glu-specific endopeptidase [Clavibacter sp. B3I6]
MTRAVVRGVVTTVVLGGCLAPALSLSSTSAHAAPEPASRADAAAEAPTVVDLPGDAAAEALAYWTPERIAETDRATAEAAGSAAGSIPAGAQAASDPAASLAGPAAGPPPISEARRAAPVPHIGRLYLGYAGASTNCSANAVASTNGLTVATAAHCMDDETDGAPRYTVFVPAYDGGAMPYGEWPVTRVTITAGWHGSYDPHLDTAFLTVASPTGRTLTDTVGASAVEFGASRSLYSSLYGYPALGKYDSQHLWTCRGPAEPAEFDDGQGVGCSMTPGASGGPWFDGVGPSGAQYSVSTNAGDGRLFSPGWGPVIRAAYLKAAS